MLNQKTESFTYFVYCWLLIGLNLVISIWIPNSLSSVFSLFIYAILLIGMYKRSPIAVIVMLPVFFLHITVLFSLNVIENGALMKEIGRVGYMSSSSAVYSFLVSLFAFVAFLVFINLKKTMHPPKTHKGYVYFGVCFMCLIIIYLLIKGFLNGFPLLAGFDRFVYRYSLNDPIMLNFLVMKVVFVSFLAMSSINLNGFKKLICHGLFVAYLLVSFLFADKFFIIITATIYYLSVHLISKESLIRKYQKEVLFILFLGFVISTCITFYVYSNNGSLSIADTSTRVFERFAEQGQLWFVVYNEDFKSISFNYEELLINIKSLIAQNGQLFASENKIGAYYFFPKYAPYDIYLSFAKKGGIVTPIMCLEPYLLHLFGIVGTCFILIAVASIYAFVCFYFYRAVLSLNPFNIILPAYLLLQFDGFLKSGNLFLLLGLGAFKNILFATFVIGIFAYFSEKFPNRLKARID